MRLLAAVATIATAAPVAFAIAGDNAPATTEPIAPLASSSTPTPATSADKAAFSALARPTSIQDRNNTLVRRIASRATVGLDASGARAIGRGASGRIWLVPGNKVLCMALEIEQDDSIGMTCEDSGTVNTRGTTLGDGNHVYGVAPDDARSVTIEGDTAPRPTIGPDGLYELPTRDVQVDLQLIDGGSRTFRVAGGAGRTK